MAARRIDGAWSYAALNFVMVSTISMAYFSTSLKFARNRRSISCHHSDRLVHCPRSQESRKLQPESLPTQDKMGQTSPSRSSYVQGRGFEKGEDTVLRWIQCGR